MHTSFRRAHSVGDIHKSVVQGIKATRRFYLSNEYCKFWQDVLICSKFICIHLLIGIFPLNFIYNRVANFYLQNMSGVAFQNTLTLTLVFNVWMLRSTEMWTAVGGHATNSATPSFSGVSLLAHYIKIDVTDIWSWW
jgi:hypothetical protein